MLIRTIKMVVNTFVCLFYLSIISPYILAAQTGNDLRFERITPEQGLSQVTINCILQDSQGFMWFGTQDGLNRYDGYQFTVYRHDSENKNSLSHNFIWSIIEDSEGDLWIGTQNGGLNKFDRKKEIFTRYQRQADDPKSLSSDNVRSILEDTNGDLWIGTQNGLNQFIRKSETFIRHQYQAGNRKSRASNNVHVVYEDRQAGLWIGTSNGLNRFDRKSKTFIEYQHQDNNPYSISSNIIYSIMEDSQGYLWVGTNSGLNRFERKSESFFHYQNEADNQRSLGNNFIKFIFEDAGADLWIATRNGVSRFNRASESFVNYQHHDNDPHSLTSNVAFTIFEDTGSNLWIGTQNGLNKLDRKTEIFSRYKHEANNEQSLSDNIVFSIAEDSEGYLWVGTNEGGLNKLDRESRTFTHYQYQSDNSSSLSISSVHAILEGSKGYLWIGTSNGLRMYNRKTESFIHYQYDADNPHSLSNNSVRAIFEDSENNLWIGTLGGGLNKFERESKRFVRYKHQAGNPESLSKNTVLTIFEDSGNILWIGTLGGGLNKFDRKTNSFVSYQHSAENEKSISDNNVAAIIEDDEGHLWIGTPGGGLNKFEPETGSFISYREKDGLPNDIVYDILKDEQGFLWLSTNKGISKFNPRTGLFVNYDQKDGLSASEFNEGASLKDRAGRLYFGSLNGVTEFYPDKVVVNTYIPAVVLTDFLLFNKSVKVSQLPSDRYQLKQSINTTQEITLEYSDNIFAFEFSALNYRQPEKNQFKYKLGGMDKDWIETDYRHRRATYTNLPHGEYLFSVKASNDDGYWNEEGTSIKVRIRPPWWLTWWAYGLYLLFFGLAIWVFISWQHKKVLFERAVNQRLVEGDKIKDEFLANTSHELRTPINGIVGLVESLINGVRGTLPADVIDDLRLAVSSGKRLSHLVNDILDFSKLRRDSLTLYLRPVDLYSLVEVVLLLSRPLLGDKKLKLVNFVDKELAPVNADENRLQQILYNLVGNAIKFTEFGEVTVSAELEANNLIRIEVKDTGIGISEDQQASIFKSFQQADGSIGRVYGGTGLGLSVSSKLVKLHGGRINVKSELGRGSRFYFSLPLAASAPYTPPICSPIKSLEDNNGNGDTGLGDTGLGDTGLGDTGLEYSIMVPYKVSQSNIKNIDAHSAKKWKLLIVDDDPINRRVVINQLYDQGYYIKEASGGEEALRILREEPIDLVLLDVMMPLISGFDVCSQLRKTKSVETLPIIFLTAKNQEADLVDGYGLGANDYLTKPITRQKLLLRVKLHLDLLYINRNLEQKVFERTETITQIAEIGREITSGLNFEKSVQTVNHRLKQLMPVDLFGIGLYEAENKRIFYRYSLSGDTLLEPYYRTTDNKNQFSVWCIENNQHIFINDVFHQGKNYLEGLSCVEEKSRFYLISEGQKQRIPGSMIYVPVTCDNEVLAVMSVHSYEKAQYQDINVKLLQSIAAYTGIALQNIQMHDKLLDSYGIIEE